MFQNDMNGPLITALRRIITGYTLRSALLVFVLLPFVLVMSLGGWYSLNTLEHQVESRMQEDIELIARAIRLPVSNALERNAIHEAEEALASVSAGRSPAAVRAARR